ncbi:CRISPR-associated protein CasA/Cse1 [Escherichia coli O145:H28]|nr:CRISPR-associated protein CasA/Cse1 [Escherichia coli O145:H28]
MLPSETMIWQPEFTDKTLSRKPGAVHELLIPDVLANVNFSQADEVIADLRDKLHQLCEMLFNQSVAPYAHHPKLISTLALARATLYKHLRELKPQGGPSNG